MSKVLAPGFELFWRLTDFLAEPNKGIPETVRIEVGETGTNERLSKDRTNWCQFASNRDPVFAANRDPSEVLGFGLPL